MTQYSPYIIPKVSMAAASINNVLCTRAFPISIDIGTYKTFLRPTFVNLATNYNHVVAVKVDNTEFCYIALRGDTWFLLHEALENIDENQCVILPKELKQAILESLTIPILKQLSSLLDVEINLVESYINIDQDDSDFSDDIFHVKHARISFALSISDENSQIKEDIFADIFFPESYNTNSINNKLMNLPAKVSDNALTQLGKISLGKIPLNLSFEIGYVSIFKQNLLNLECGNILLPDKLFTTLKAGKQEHVQLTLSTNCVNNTKQLYALCSIETNQVKVLEAWKMNEINMELEEQESFEEEIEESVDIDNELNQNIVEDSPINIQSALGDIEVMLSFELERRSMLLSDVQDISAGYTFALNSKPDAPVTLRVNGKNIGQGRLVDMNGLMGVEVIKLVKA